MFTLWSNWGFLNKPVFTVLNTSGFTDHVQGSGLIDPPISPVEWRGKSFIYKLVVEPGKFQILLRNLFGIPPSISLVWSQQLVLKAFSTPGAFCLFFRKNSLAGNHGIPAQNIKEQNRYSKHDLSWHFHNQLAQMLLIPKSLRYFICLLLWNSPSKIPYLDRLSPSFGLQILILHLLTFSSH